MKIISSRLDDLRRERDEWEENRAASQARYDEQKIRYDKAIEDVIDPIRQRIISDLRKFNLLEFDVYVNITSDYIKDYKNRNRVIEIRVNCNQNRLHDEASALSWDYTARIRGGEVVKESGSWSGLNATTPENIASLKQTVEALEYLNAQDWEAILRTEIPNYEDYITEPLLRNRPDFESQIKEAELESFIGKDIAVRGTGLEQLGYNTRSTGWYIIKRETPKKYVVCYFSDYELKRSGLDTSDESAIIDRYKDYFPQQIKKEYLVPVLSYPFETMGN